jgi:hypothetical protein
VTDQDKTDDGRYIVIKGQKWRASDPAVCDAARVVGGEASLDALGQS